MQPSREGGGNGSGDGDVPHGRRTRARRRRMRPSHRPSPRRRAPGRRRRPGWGAPGPGRARWDSAETCCLPWGSLAAASVSRRSPLPARVVAIVAVGERTPARHGQRARDFFYFSIFLIFFNPESFARFALLCPVGTCRVALLPPPRRGMEAWGPHVRVRRDEWQLMRWGTILMIA